MSERKLESEQQPSLYQRLTSYFGSSNNSPNKKPNQLKENAPELDESPMPAKAESEVTKTRLLLRADQVVAMTDGVIIHQHEGLSEPTPRREEEKKEKAEVYNQFFSSSFLRNCFLCWDHVSSDVLVYFVSEIATLN